jgi:hypothetical protein
MSVTNYVWDPITDSVVHETDGASETQVTYEVRRAGTSTSMISIRPAT